MKTVKLGRPKKEDKKTVKKSRTVSLTDNEVKELTKAYGSLTIAIKTLLEPEF